MVWYVMEVGIAQYGMVCYGSWYSPVWYVMEVGIAQYGLLWKLV